MTTFVVTTSADVANGDVSENDLSLREAIDLANANPGADRIAFADEVNYIALTDKLPTISDGLRLVGGGDVVLDANADGDMDPGTARRRPVEIRRGLDLDGDGIAVTIDGLTITGGSIDVGDSSDDGGAGIRAGARVDLTVVDSEILRNQVGGYYATGGGLLAKGDCTVIRSNLSQNSAVFGAGVAVFGEAKITNSDVSSNRGSFDYGGAGAGVHALSDITLRGTRIENNKTGSYAVAGVGGIYSRRDVRLIDCQVVGNVGDGGGIDAQGTVTAVDTLVADNSARGFGYYGTSAGGGGIWAPVVRLIRSEVSGNRASADYARGGGIIAAEVEIHSSSVIHNHVTANRSTSYGGGLWITRIDGRDPFLVARNSTVAWNRADGYGAEGGGIGATRAARIALIGVTLTGNRVTPESSYYAGEGSAIAATGAKMSLKNSIVVGNTSANGGNEIFGSPKLRSSIVDGDSRDIFADAVRIAPRIFAGVLDENGGQTSTVALLPGRDNPAIGSADARTAAATDQRGVARDAHPDIGAFEARGPGGTALIGTDGPDALSGTDRRDRIEGRGGDDALRGLDGSDHLRGGADDDTVRGNKGKDAVEGGGGSDEIFGGRDDDSLRGGAGPDRFVFFQRFGVDVIEDFEARPASGQDRIDLRHLGISAGNFQDRVTITDLGGTTLVAVEDAGAILCRGVTGEGANAISLQDFLLLA